MLKKALEKVLTTKELDELISAFDQIGDIIIVRIPETLLPKKKMIGETLLKEVKNRKECFLPSISSRRRFSHKKLRNSCR